MQKRNTGHGCGGAKGKKRKSWKENDSSGAWRRSWEKERDYTKKNSARGSKKPTNPGITGVSEYSPCCCPSSSHFTVPAPVASAARLLIQGTLCDFITHESVCDIDEENTAEKEEGMTGFFFLGGQRHAIFKSCRVVRYGKDGRQKVEQKKRCTVGAHTLAARGEFEIRKLSVSTDRLLIHSQTLTGYTKPRPSSLLLIPESLSQL